jgi:hypothetical protein
VNKSSKIYLYSRDYVKYTLSVILMTQELVALRFGDDVQIYSWSESDVKV